MIEENQIPKGSLKMLQEEAWELFTENRLVGDSHDDESTPPSKVQIRFYDAVEHALNHALEEGILVLKPEHPGPSLWSKIS